MRVAVVTESFLPTSNGVTNSVVQVARRLLAAGHDVLIIAPGQGPETFEGAKVVRTPAVPLPGYATIPVGVPTLKAFAELEAFQPDVAHIAGPVALGAWGAGAATRLRIPSVAIYQTDFPRYTSHYNLGMVKQLAWRWVRRIHSTASRTLAPSSAAAWDLRRNGVPEVHIWGRGVDLERFHPSKRDEGLRKRLAPGGEAIVGYVGRLAPEKEVHLLRRYRRRGGVELVIVGDGPDRERLEGRLRGATFLGHRGGEDLAKLYASLDVFVHTGPHETFCQTIQEALASGVPVVAPAIGGPLDLVRHGTNGFFFRPGNPRSLASAIDRLTSDTATRARLAANARAGVEGRSWEALTRELVAHYRHAIRAGAPRRELLTFSGRGS